MRERAHPSPAFKRDVIVQKFFRFFLALVLLASGSVAFATITPGQTYRSSWYGTGAPSATYSVPDASLSQCQMVTEQKVKAFLNQLQGNSNTPSFSWTLTVQSGMWSSLINGGSSGGVSCTPLGTPNICPAGSVLTAGVCVCDATHQEQGGTCVAKKTENEMHCELMGQGGYTRGATGKTGGTVPATICFLTDPPFPDEPGKGCLMTTGDAVVVPQDDGSRAFSVVAKYTGGVCTPAADPVLGDPRSTKEDKCPGGFEGMVNGVASCVSAQPDKGVEGVKTTVKTNPDGSKTSIKEETKCTGVTCTTTTTTTNTPAGGGTATTIVSGTTQSLADKCALDKTNPVCTKSGTTDPTLRVTGGTGEGEGMECGVDDKPSCKVKIDEEGTPVSVATAFDGAKGDLDTQKGIAETQINGAASIQAPTWSFSFQLPTGCTGYDVAVFKGLAFKMNPCTYQSTIHDLMSMIWAAVTAFCIIGMVGRTIREA